MSHVLNIHSMFVTMTVLFSTFCSVANFLLFAQVKSLSQEHVPIYFPELILCVEIYAKKSTLKKVNAGNFIAEKIMLF